MVAPIIISGLPAPSRPLSSTLAGSEAIAAAVVATAASIVVGAYLIDRAGWPFTPSVILPLALAVGLGTLAAFGRSATRERAGLTAFAAVVTVVFAWLMWIARPSFLPLGSGPDLTHHILLIQYIERHWRLVHVAGVEDYLGEMVYYTPGSHILTALAGAWSGRTGFHALHALMSATVAVKAGIVFLIANRVLPRDVPRLPIALIAPIALFASQTYFLGSFAEYSFLAQVVAELFAVAMWWALVVWHQDPGIGLMAFTGLTGAALFLTWPVLIGPPLVVLGALVVLPHRTPFRSRVAQASIAAGPIIVVASLFIAGRTGLLVIAGTGGQAVWPSVRAYGWWLLVLSSAGIAIAVFKAITSRADLKVRTTSATTRRADLKVGTTTETESRADQQEPDEKIRLKADPTIGITTPESDTRVTALFVAAMGLQTAALYAFARLHSNEPYMALKMFYLLLYPQAVGVALAVGEVWARLTPDSTVRLPPSRPQGASASLAGAFGGGGKPDTTTTCAPTVRLKPDTTYPLAWTLVALVAFFVARPLMHAPRTLQVGQHPATSVALEQAGEWARAHVPIKCVEYLVGDDETAYWLHLAVLGNARQGTRTGDNATYELTPALVRWLTPGGLPYGIADLPALPSDIRSGLDIVAQFGTAAVVKRRGTSSCDEK